MGSEMCIRDRYILEKYGYSKADFSPNDLPRFKSASDGDDSNTAQTSTHSPRVHIGTLHVWRSIWIVICDMQKAQQSQIETEHKYGEQKSYLTALSTLAAKYRLHGGNADGSIHPCSNQHLVQTMRNAWSSYTIRGKSTRPPWTEALISDWKPEYIRKIVDATELLAREEGFPVYETNDRTASVPPQSEPQCRADDSPFHPETPTAPSIEELSPVENPGTLRAEHHDTRRQNPSSVQRDYSSATIQRPALSRKRARSVSTDDGEYVRQSVRSSVSDYEDNSGPQSLHSPVPKYHIQSVSSP